MKYKVLYDTLINKSHQPKGSEIEFEEGTDEGYIKRLVNAKVIAPLTAEDADVGAKSQERIALEQKAQELGIKFQDNIKDEVLKKKIAKAQEAQE